MSWGRDMSWALARAWPRDMSRNAIELVKKYSVASHQTAARFYPRRMARAPRLLVAGGTYHVTARGNRRREIFIDRYDRELFLRLLSHVVAQRRWGCHAFCLMPNHYHLLVETPEPDLSLGMYRLNALYAQRFNRRHDVDGHVFQGRFNASLVEDDSHLLEVTRYIVLNPVRAGLCQRPGDWQWSSYSESVGDRPAPPFLSLEGLLAQFDGDAARYAAFVADAAY